MKRPSLDAVVHDLETQIPRLLSANNVPGLSMTVIRDAKIYWSKGFGVCSVLTQEAVTPEVLFEACSLSKLVFAYAVLRLVCEGKLNLDTPLTEYLNEPFAPDEPDLPLITARHVLSHTTGFPNWRPREDHLKIHFKPGSRFSYSGEGFMYLQAVMEHIVRADLSEYLLTEFMQPMGMMHSRYTWVESCSLPIAIGHDEHGKATKKRPWVLCSAVSLHSTSQDFARLMCAVMRPDADNPIHLDAVLTGEMLTPQIPVNDSPPWKDGWTKANFKISPSLSWGLGWGLQATSDGNSIWHWGDNWNYQAFAVGDLETNHGIVIMTNGNKGQQIITTILKEIVGGTYPCIDWLNS